MGTKFCFITTVNLRTWVRIPAGTDILDSIVDRFLTILFKFTIKIYIYSEISRAMENHVCERTYFGGVLGERNGLSTLLTGVYNGRFSVPSPLKIYVFDSEAAVSIMHLGIYMTSYPTLPSYFSRWEKI